jgi:FAD synthase
MRIDFLQRLRGEKLFPSVETLTEQIAKDVERAREICSRHAA